MGRPCQSGQKHTVKVTAGGRPGAGLDTLGGQAHGRRAAATPLALAQLPSLDQAPFQSSHLLIMGVHVPWKCNCEHIAMSGNRFRYCEPDMCVHACANMSTCLPCLQSCWRPSHLGVGAQSRSLHHSQGLALGLEFRWCLGLGAPAAESEVGIFVQVSLEGGLPGEREGGKEGARPQLEVSFSLIPGVGFIKVYSGLLLCILVLFLGLSSPQG